MADNEDITQRLSDYSLRTNTNAMATALLDQRQSVTERRVEEYHQRLHKAEDDLLVTKTVQAIHDTQIQSMRKILIGNGDRETIPMDMDRMERAIEEILKTNWRQIGIDLEAVKKWQDGFDKKIAWVWGAIGILVINRVWEIFFTP
jgi:hypothetical protein